MIQNVAALTLLFLVVIVASKPVEYKLCGQLPHSFKVNSVDLAPNKIQAGSEIIITINGTAVNPITSGTTIIEVYYLGIKVNTERIDLCESLGGCPVARGTHRVSFSKQKLPNFAPKGKYLIISKQRDRDGQDLGCIQFDMIIE